MNQEKIGTFIKQKRIEKGLTQEQLAANLDVNPKTISRWERGLNIPDSSILLPLSIELGVTTSELMLGELKNEDFRMKKRNVDKNRNTSMLEVFKSKKAKLFYICTILFSIISGVIDYNNIIEKDFDNVCKYPTSKFTSLDGEDYNYCIGPFYYIKYHNYCGDVTILPIEASDKIEMGIWFLPSLTIKE